MAGVSSGHFMAQVLLIVPVAEALSLIAPSSSPSARPVLVVWCCRQLKKYAKDKKTPARLWLLDMGILRAKLIPMMLRHPEDT